MHRALLIDLFALPEYDISLALGYLKAYADADPAVCASWSVEMKHFPVATPAAEVAAFVESAAPDLVGFSCYSWNIRAVERALAQLPGRKPLVALGGIEVTPDPSGCLRRNPRADLVVFGEGEETFREVLSRLEDGPAAFGPATMKGLPGVAWRDGKSVLQNQPRPPLPDISVIPSPYTAGSFGDLLPGQDRVMVETARGCPYTCTFCFEPRGFAKVRSFPGSRVKEEIAHIVRAGVREVAFLDTNFNMDRKRAVELWDHLHELGGRVRYAFELRGELVDAAQARSLSRLDYFAEIGLQSVNAASLEAVKRWHEPERFQEGLRLLLEAGIYRPCAHSAHGGVAVDLMMGLPHENLDDVLASFDFVFGLNPSTVVLTVTKILPGTELHDDREKFRYAFDPDAQYEMTSSATVTKEDVRQMLLFRDGVDFAYNRLHAVRTMAWFAAGVKMPPSRVFLDLGRWMAGAGKPPAELTMEDLSRFLAEFGKARGAEALGRDAGGRLAAEGLVNALQRLREAKRAWWAHALFRVGFRMASWFGGLPPLPTPVLAPEPNANTEPDPRFASPRSG